MRDRALLGAGLALLLVGALLAPSAEASVAMPPPLDPKLERLENMVVHDRDLARRGKLKLGALSDGYFNVIIDRANGRVVIEMPPLRAERLQATRRLIGKRYGEAPVRVGLAPRVRPSRERDPKSSPKPGEPFACRGEVIAVGQSTHGAAAEVAQRAMTPKGDGWNAKRIIGKRIARAQRMALTHGCAVRVAIIDGMELALTRDYVSNRMNVAVRAGRVTHILGLG